MFLRSGLHVHPAHIHIHRRGDVALHLFNIGPQFGSLGNHGHINVTDPVAILRHLLSHDLQQLQGVRALVSGIRIGKMFADVPQSRSTQQRIGNRMEQHIRIGVAQKSQFIGNLHTAQDQIPVRHQFVHVVSVSDPHFSSSSSISAIFRSMGVVTFRFFSSPSTIFTFMPIRSTAEQSSVTSAPS